MKFILIFFAVQLVNVIFNTVRLIFTVKAPKQIASLFTALSYGIYTIVLVYTARDFNLWAKVAVAFTSNLIGVYVSMAFLEKFKKDKVWKIEAILPFNNGYNEMIASNLESNGFKATIIYGKGFQTITVYAETQAESQKFVDLMKPYRAKFVAFEQNARVLI